MSAVGALQRLPAREPPRRLPEAVAGDPGLVVVDATWGTIQPLQLPGGVRTVGELEVIEHVRRGGPLVDTRRAEYVAAGTIPTAIPISHEEIVARRGELSVDPPTILFCNGPQCAATPWAVAALLEAGHPAEALRYYRGGIHDWVTLGLPLSGSPSAAALR
jgi:rhodanese-related sulfurtransferase